MAAVLGATILAVAGAIALSPLAPVGQVRQFDPVRGVQADGLVLGAGSALLAATLLAVLAVMGARATRPVTRPDRERPSAVARAAAAAGLPAPAVVASRNALEPGSGQQAVPVRATLLGSIAAVTAVIAAAVFGASLTGLVTHPARYGWNWQILIQAEGGYGNFTPGVMNRLVGGQPAVAAWSSFGFSQLTIDNRVVPVLGLQRDRGSLEPPTSSGQAITDNGQIELGAVTLRELGKKIGDTVLVGSPPYRRPLTISGIVTLPSFGVAISQHVSLGQGAMLSERELLAVQGLTATARSPPQIPPRPPRRRWPSTWFPAPARPSARRSCTGSPPPTRTGLPAGPTNWGCTARGPRPSSTPPRWAASRWPWPWAWPRPRCCPWP